MTTSVARRHPNVRRTAGYAEKVEGAVELDDVNSWQLFLLEQGNAAGSVSLEIYKIDLGSNCDRFLWARCR
jgi:hypothetical protein